MAIIGNASLLKELKENYNGSDDNAVTFFGSATINVQTFTIGSVKENVPFNLSSFKLKLYRTGSPGTTGYIYFYDMSAPVGIPYLTPINIITFNPNSLSTSATWYEFNLISSDWFICNRDDIYAIGVKITSGGLGNSISWRCDATSPTYSGGNRVFSTDTGATWTHDTTRDFMFEVYGKDLYNNTITVYNNTKHTTGDYATNYNRENGFKAWLNFTGAIPTIHMSTNIKNATGTLQNTFTTVEWAYNVWANYTGYSLLLNILENLKNCTGTKQSYYNSVTGWKIYNNYTGFSILLNAIEKLINCTGTHASYYNSATGWRIYLNYTGNISGGGSTVNRTINITLNGHGFFNSWNGSINTNVQNISILMNSDKSIIGNFSDNDSFYEDKYFLSGILTFNEFQFCLLIMLGLWIFLISKVNDDSLFGVLQVFIGLPLSVLVGGYAYLNSLSYGYMIGICILLISLLVLFFAYWKKPSK
jgi:hypothetical protein